MMQKLTRKAFDLQANGKGFAEFAGLRNSSAASLCFGRRTSDDLFSVIAFQTSAVSSSVVLLI